jgi:hypothetical protein
MSLAREVRNPLTMIAFFLGASEITAGIAATQASGWTQGLLTIFAVAFPPVVGAAFFFILWNRPYVLYAPADYPEHTSVAKFVEAIASNRAREAAAIDASLKSAVESAVQESSEPSSSPAGAQQDDLVAHALVRAREELVRRSIIVHLGDFATDPETSELRFTPDARSSVADLLNLTYLSIAQFVAPYSYAREWVLEDPATGRTFPEIGTAWARSALKRPYDDRPLEEVGLLPGMQLRVVPVPPPSSKGVPSADSMR